MEVDFNNLRRKACLTYDSLASKLNNAIKSYEKEYLEKGTLMIDSDEIQQEMDDLRVLIGSIACVFIEGDPGLIDVFEETYPNEKEMVTYNPEID